MVDGVNSLDEVNKDTLFVFVEFLLPGRKDSDWHRCSSLVRDYTLRYIIQTTGALATPQLKPNTRCDTHLTVKIHIFIINLFQIV